MNKFIFILISTFCFAFVKSEFRSKEISTKLPYTQALTTATFDGVNSIYLIGGTNGSTRYTEEIYQFDVSSEQLKVLRKLEGGISAHSSVLDDEGNIFIFGGNPSINYRRVLKFTPKENKLENVANFSRSVTNSKAIWCDGNAYIFSLLDIFKYSKAYNNITRIGSLSRSATGNFDVIIDCENRTSYIFHYYTTNSLEIWKYVLDAPSVQIFHTIITNQQGISAVWTGVFAYFGFYNGLQSYNPINKRVANETVNNNFPARIYSSGTVYVNTTRSIYIFGGQSSSSIYEDKIRYISLENVYHPTICSDIKEGIVCSEKSCPRCGYCVNKISYFYRCNKDVYELETCSGDLWWNPEYISLNNETTIGSCDIWDNLSNSTKEGYLSDKTCFSDCKWGQDDDCSPFYWFENLNEGIERKYYSCPSRNDSIEMKIFWDSRSESCQICNHVIDTNGNQCLC